MADGWAFPELITGNYMNTCVHIITYTVNLNCITSSMCACILLNGHFRIHTPTAYLQVQTPWFKSLSSFLLHSIKPAWIYTQLALAHQLPKMIVYSSTPISRHPSVLVQILFIFRPNSHYSFHIARSPSPNPSPAPPSPPTDTFTRWMTTRPSLRPQL